MATNRTAADQGVTLIELLVMLVIASVSLSVVMPSIGAGLTGLRLRSAARELAGIIIRAREQAIYHQQQYQLVVNASRDVIGVSPTSGGIREEYPLPSNILVSVEGEHQVGAGRYNATNDQVWSLDINPDGGIAAAVITLFADDHSVRVMLDPLTGSALVKEH